MKNKKILIGYHVGIKARWPTAKLSVNGNSTFSGNMTVQDCIIFASGGGQFQSPQLQMFRLCELGGSICSA